MGMTMDACNSILFYDIASGPPVTCFAASPWKTRFSLNFKKLPYVTTWVDLTDIPAMRRALGVPAVRFHEDGTDFYTLPIIHDPKTDQRIGDTFDIAVYLDSTYPDSPRLIRDGTTDLMAAFNTEADAVFSSSWRLWAHGMPLNPETAEDVHAEFERRHGVKWEDMTATGEKRVKETENFKAALQDFAKLYRKRKEGPFVEGGRVTYADFVVGAWLKLFEASMGEFEQVKEWDDGLWGRLHDALKDYAEVK